MFERYTEKARRVIFIARYEASQFGSPYIETEHLLIGLLREDKSLAQSVLRSDASAEKIRKQIEQHTPPREKTSTSVDLPLSHESKRVLAYGAEEAERLKHLHIGTAHLLLGLLREEKSFAAHLLREHGVTRESVIGHMRGSESPRTDESACFARVDEWIAVRQARGGIRTVKQERVADKTAHFAIYAGDQREQTEGEGMAPAQKAEDIQKRIHFIVDRMENAIANHEFEKARFYSEEERKERENLRRLREQFNLDEMPPQMPLVCIVIIGDERFSEVQKRSDAFLAKGVPEVWLLDPVSKRAYTVTTSEGLRECKSGTLQIANPPLEMDLETIFS